MKHWDSSKAGGRLCCLMIFLAAGFSPLRADTVPDAEPSAADPIIAEGSGIQIKQSDFDQAMGPMKFEYQARGRAIPGYFTGVVIENLIEYGLLVERANDGDRTKGVSEANNDVTNHINECGSLDNYHQSLDSSDVAEGDVLAVDKKADIARAALVRLLGISVSDADARTYYDDRPVEFRYPDGSLVAFTNIEDEIKQHIEDEQAIQRGPDFIHYLKDQEQVHILNPDLLFAYNEFQLSQTGVALHAPAIVLPVPAIKSASFSVNNFQSGDSVIEHGVLTLRADGTAHWSAVVFTYRQNSSEVWRVSWDVLDKAGVKVFSLPEQSGPRMYSGSSPGASKYQWDVDFKYDAGLFEKASSMTLHGSC